jgi:undecaprenyl-diphosphatase
MHLWISRGVRWFLLFAGCGALAGLIHLFGSHSLDLVQGLDQTISALLNPDSYLPVFDEFFRAYTDYANLVLALPLLSLAVAAGLHRLTRMSAGGATLWAMLACVLWWLTLGLLQRLYAAPQNAVLTLGAVAPVLIVVGAIPPLLISRLDARRWLTMLLIAETMLFGALVLTGRLWWNASMPMANYLLLVTLLTALGATAWAFHRMEEAALSRYTRVFWLVLLSVVLGASVATNTIKDSIARPRPLAEAYAPWNEALRVIPEEELRGRSSYPSGHTSGTFALITPLFWWTRRRRTRAALLGLGVVQGVSRVYTVAHFTSDVVMGATLGFGTGTLVFFLLGGPSLRAPEEQPEEEAGKILSPASS